MWEVVVENSATLGMETRKGEKQVKLAMTDPLGSVRWRNSGGEQRALSLELAWTEEKRMW